MNNNEIADVKSFDKPNEVREFPKGRLKLLEVAGTMIGFAEFKPGWRWSESVQPLVQTHSCEATHFQYHISGTMVVKMDDGTEYICNPGDVSWFPAGHDAWTVGDEPCVVVDFYGMSEYAHKLEDIVNKHAEERKKTEEELRIAAIAFESQEGMCIMNKDFEILRVNDAFSKIVGDPAKESIGQSLQLIKSGLSDKLIYDQVLESAERDGSWQGEMWNRNKNRNKYAAQVTITAVKNEMDLITHYVCSMHDITLRKEAEKKINTLAFYDSLTELPNRRMLNDRLYQTIEMSKRSSVYGAVMFLDLDKFKPVNDTYGHNVGDTLLVEVAKRILSCVRKVDTVARFGGDEFVVLVQELSHEREASQEQVLIIAEKIRYALSKPYSLRVEESDLSETIVEHNCFASIGATVFIGDEIKQKDILKQADISMYRAKKLGRNRVEVSSPL